MMAALDVIVNWAHMAAGFTWVGGIIFVNIVLTPAVQPKGLPPEFVRIMGMERFRYVAWASIGVLLTSGVYNVVRGMARAAGPANEAFVTAFLIKMAVVAAMIAITVVNSVVLRRRLVNAEPGKGGPTPEMKATSGRLVVLSRVNLALGLTVLLMVAVMRAALS